ncbi:hypothetical protein IIV25_007L [Invertebrate iridovirus 25]|uniref:Uncharacterized protein n=1 Tax=Invertebrate iridovirus 25 TaxID=1301280 RepID=W8W2D7_9VIRU|nr:tail fiber protein [Invertebrate iridovirus 25]CCV02025.1 hypothetical protein IIV25_007L [Invertebrate iridovirus 25]
MSSSSGNFRVYDPVAQLIAAGGGGGGGLPATGGTLTGNLTMQVPSKVVQCQAPTGPCDLTNKAYVDSLIGGGPFLPLSGGTMSGQIVQSLAPVAPTNLANKAYVDSLAGGGPFLPLSGGVMSGQIIQSLAPTTGTNLANKTYVDSLAGGGPFLPLSGGVMSGQIVQSLAPTVATNLANKAYVDAQVSAVVVPDATSSVKGIVQLSGDLSGTAAAPVVAPLTITNSKLANLGGVSQLKGSGSASSAAADLSLGPNLSITGTTLSINTASLSSTFLPLAGGVMSGAISQPLAPSAANDLANKAYVDAQVSAVVVPDATSSVKGIVQLSGDLSGTAAAPVVAPLTITNAKLANLSAVSQLKGSSSASSAATDITLGSGLSMTGSTLSVNPTTLNKAGATQFGVVEFDPAGDLAATAPNSGIGVIKPLAITNAKLANLSAVSQLKGSTSASASAADISLGSGLIMTTNTLSVDSTTLPVIPVSKGGTGATTLTGYLKGSGTSPITSVSSIPVADVTGAVGSVNGILPSPSNGGNVTMLFGNVTTGTLAARPVSPGTNGNIYVVSGDPTPSNNGRTYISDGTTWQEVTANQAATDARYVIKSGDTMTGNLVVPSGTKVQLTDLPTAGTDAANKNYVDAQIAGGSTPDATTSIKGKIQLAGDFDPSSTAAVPVIKSATSSVLGKVQLAGDLSGTAAAPVVAPLTITNTKLANLSAVSQLKGSSSASSAAADISLGSNLSMTGSTLNVNTASLSSSFLPLAGGTMSGAISQPLAPSVANDLANKAYVDAQISSAAPDATTSVKGVVQLSGDLSGTATSPLVAPLTITNSKLANLGGVSQLKGSGSASSAATDLSLGPNLSITGTTLSINTASLSSTFLPLAGGTMSGAISQPLPPSAANDLANKAYVDAQITSVTVPDATTSVKGKIQLAGDLGGTAAAPVVAPMAITNAKLANLSAVSQLKGSSSASSTATDITLGSGLSMTSSTLSVDSTTIQKAGATQFGVVEFDPSGDLAATAANSGIGVVKPLAITNPKINPGAGNTLKGTNSLTNIDDITIGSGLQLSAGAGPTLSVNPTTLQKAGATQFGTIEFDPSGDLAATAANSGIGVVKPLAITNAKLANTGSPGQLKGSSQGSSTVTDLTIGTGLLLSGSTLSSTAAVLNVVQSTTLYTILGSAPSPTTPVNMTDYTINVNAGQGVKVNYSWNYQSAGGGTAYSPSFGWSGTSVSDAFQAHIPGIFQGGASPLCTAIFQSTPPTQYTLSTTNADSNLNQSFTLSLAGLNGPAVAIHAIVYYKNNGGSTVALTPIFNRDNKTAGGVTVQIAGGWMDYTFF